MLANPPMVKLIIVNTDYFLQIITTMAERYIPQREVINIIIIDKLNKILWEIYTKFFLRKFDIVYRRNSFFQNKIIHPSIKGRELLM
ncbi:hypothetical protein ASV16_01955 [Enterobacter cloacae subsp. cloacae]|nr:hypothetical protein ASV19_13755 [Enterobacter cloacae subsp. cloacae]KTH90282.1 hypothetical protein ASV16_01955 [Enterobacter cloacae subsp. cloacae]KTJ82399.1 hypothetical protein ASU78_09030 [Enterobacter cloacae subsp. cloacae]